MEESELSQQQPTSDRMEILCGACRCQSAEHHSDMVACSANSAQPVRLSGAQELRTRSWLHRIQVCSPTLEARLISRVFVVLFCLVATSEDRAHGAKRFTTLTGLFHVSERKARWLQPPRSKRPKLLSWTVCSALTLSCLRCARLCNRVYQMARLLGELRWWQV